MKVLAYPHPALRFKCKPLKRINQEIRDIVAEMFETMYATSGVGLAANQVGLPFQVFVMNPAGNKEEKNQEYVFINPVILKKSGKVCDSEGCLSFPDIQAEVVRSEEIGVEAISLSGEEQYFQWKDHLARIVQHEMDHLNGTCFIDRLGATAKLNIRSELEDLHIIHDGEQRSRFEPEDDVLQNWKEYERKFC